ncbi:TELO2-interacting protein 2-like [Mya arenaria]|uniref:TELO2-interacting protein 2-like n=1 Tax=Mya arenaria TaxID=6604 RepID=UPI0022E1CF18|nr:TELO2-interacting protein 2-like [Mya arenaria]
MAVQLKTLICQINVQNGCFYSKKDKDFALHLYERHSLQSMLETTGEVMRDKKWRDLCDKYIAVVTVLIDNGPVDWISTFINGFNEQETFAMCVGSLKTVCRFAESKSFAGRDYTVYDASDFEDVAYKGYLVLNLLQFLLKKLVLVGRGNKDLDHWRALLQNCYFCVFIVSQHAERHQWTSEKSTECAVECIQLLKEEFCCLSMCQLLILDTKYVSPLVESETEYKSAVKKSIYGKLLVQWKPMLQRNTWKYNPVVCASFSWCLEQMIFPYVSDFIELILPPTLLFIDDHELHNKMNGTNCLIHILKNTTGEELRWYGRAEVIYSALKLQLVSTEETLLPLTHEAMFLTLKILEKNPDALGTNTRYDEVLQNVLQAASHENKLALRRVHTQPLKHFIEILGINSVKYTPILLEVIEEYLDVSDAPTEEARLNILDTLNVFIKVAYPRMHAHMGSLMKILVKVLHNIVSKTWNIKESVKENLTKKCVECFELLKAVDGVFFTKTISSMKSLPFDSACTEIFDRLLASVSL